MIHHPRVLGQVIGIPAGTTDEEVRGTAERMIGELDQDSGHGTFIAGLVRQACPDALILDIRLFGNSGVVAESALLRSLQLLALRQALALNGDTDYQVVDVVSMSLGYYHEQPEDSDFDALLHGPIRVLGKYGAAVVVSAGNDATARPIYPAAFAPYQGGSVAGRGCGRPGDVRRRPQPRQHHRAVQQRRRVGALPAAGRRVGEHHADDVRRVDGAGERVAEQPGRMAHRARPRRLHAVVSACGAAPRSPGPSSPGSSPRPSSTHTTRVTTTPPRKRA